MNKLIGTALVLLCVATQTQASQTSHAATLEKEHKDPKSLASLLPRDIVEHTKPFLHSCPVLTISNEVLNRITSHPSTHLNDIDKAKKDILEWDMLQTHAGSFIYNTKHNYIYEDDGVGVHLGDARSRKSVKDVLVEHNPSIELKGTLIDTDENPNSAGSICFYEGSMPGKYYFQFRLRFRGNDSYYPKKFDRIVNHKSTIRIDD